MSLFNSLKKATSLLIEMPEQDNRPLTSRDFPDMDALDTELPKSAQYTPQESAPVPRSIEQIMQADDGPNLDQIQVAPEQIPAQAEGAPLDFTSIYRAAKLPETAFGAEQMLETLKSLPPELPLETKRATVRAMLSTLGKTTGATPETIVADATRKLAALASFEKFMQSRTEQNLEKAQAEIAELELQIEARRIAVQTAKTEFARIQGECEVESEKIDDVLEFFSLDTGASKLAPSQNAGDSAASTSI